MAAGCAGPDEAAPPAAPALAPPAEGDFAPAELACEGRRAPRAERRRLSLPTGLPFAQALWARTDAEERANAAAEALCAGAPLPPDQERAAARYTVDRWRCAPIGHAWRCGLEAEVSCRLQPGRCEPGPAD